VLACVVAPLNAFALPRTVAVAPLPAVSSSTALPVAPMRPEGWPFTLLVAAFALHFFILSGVTSNLLAMLQRGGMDAATVVAVGALFGPAQVAARLVDFLTAGRTHPLWIARGAVTLTAFAFAMLAFVGASPLVAALFAIAFGAANGVMTVARGALPLLMFGPTGYGRVIGRIARPGLFVQALAPFVVASAVERFSTYRARNGNRRRAAGARMLPGDQAARALDAAQRVALRSGMKNAAPRPGHDASVEHRVDIVLRGVAGVAGEFWAVQQAGIADAIVDRAGGVRLDGIDATPDIQSSR